MQKVFIAIPAYDGKMAVGTAMALISNINELHAAGIKAQVKSEEGNCYITTARNSLTRMFLETDCTELIFVDTDMWFEDKAMLKILQWDKDIVCGVYPKKKDEPDYTARPFINDETGKLISDPLNGLIELDAGPTGLMRIKREVIETLIKKNPHLEYATNDGKQEFDLFECVLKDKVWWGEDYAFCHKAREQGFRIFAEADIEFCHIGNKKWYGNFKKHIIEKGVI